MYVSTKRAIISNAIMFLSFIFFQNNLLSYKKNRIERALELYKSL